MGGLTIAASARAVNSAKAPICASTAMTARPMLAKKFILVSIAPARADALPFIYPRHPAQPGEDFIFVGARQRRRFARSVTSKVIISMETRPTIGTRTPLIAATPLLDKVRGTPSAYPSATVA